MTLYGWIKKFGSKPTTPSSKIAQANLVGTSEGLRVHFPCGAYLEVNQANDFDTIASLLNVYFFTFSLFTKNQISLVTSFAIFATIVVSSSVLAI